MSMEENQCRKKLANSKEFDSALEFFFDEVSGLNPVFLKKNPTAGFFRWILQNISNVWGELFSGLRRYSQNQKCLVQTSLGARLKLRTQSRYEAPVDLQVEIIKTQ